MGILKVWILKAHAMPSHHRVVSTKYHIATSSEGKKQNFGGQKSQFCSPVETKFDHRQKGFLLQPKPKPLNPVSIIAKQRHVLYVPLKKLKTRRPLLIFAIAIATVRAKERCIIKISVNINRWWQIVILVINVFGCSCSGIICRWLCSPSPPTIHDCLNLLVVYWNGRSRSRRRCRSVGWWRYHLNFISCCLG